jgi:hypothetical protein
MKKTIIALAATAALLPSLACWKLGKVANRGDCADLEISVCNCFS